MDTDKGEMAKARTTPHESKTRPMPEPNVCAECGLSPWDDIHIRPSQARTAKAREARRINVLRRKAPEYVAALRELGYTVIPPKCGRHYHSETAGTALVCVLSPGHEGDHSWYELDES